MNAVSSRIWIRVAASISYNDNHYANCTSRAYIVAGVLYVEIICESVLSHTFIFIG